MRKRTGDWRDLLSAYDLALEGNKVCVGLVAVVVTVLVMAAAVFLYGVCAGAGLLTAATWELSGSTEFSALHVFTLLVMGQGFEMLGTFLPLLNPIAGGLGHFIFSLLLWAALFWIWSGTGGIISRLAVLEYARDDLPTLGDARQLVRSKRGSYMLALVWPLIVIAFCAALNALGGLVASVPYVGRVLLVFPGYPLLVISAVGIVFVAVVSVLGFGIIMPAVSASGRGGLESWITACSYVLYGLRRFVCYTVVAGIIGIIAAVVAWALGEFLIYVIYKTVNIGFLPSMAWLDYEAGETGIALYSAGTGWNGFFSTLMVALLMIIRAVPAAYVFSYFFTANTVVFFLLRKEVDNVEIDEVYEEEEGEEEVEGLVEPAAAAPAEPEAEEKPAEEEPAEEPGGEEQAPEEEEAPEAEEEAPPKRKPRRKKSTPRKSSKPKEEG